MNDRFRFRVFYKPHNKIYNVICLNSDRQKEIIIEYKGSTALVEWKNCNVLQCTGLKDKNGKLIYEGDIVKFNYDTDEIIAVVSWDDNEGQIGYYLNTTDYFKDKYVTDYDFYKNDYEVLGNIYENKFLLESEG